jgi:hypothetical protein
MAGRPILEPPFVKIGQNTTADKVGVFVKSSVLVAVFFNQKDIDAKKYLAKKT